MLTGPRLIKVGYGTGPAKQALDERNLSVGPGVPAQAVASLVAASGPLSEGGRYGLVLRAAESARRDFATDRGERTLKAWSLTVTGSLAPIVVLDAEEQERIWSSAEGHLGVGGEVAGARADLDAAGTRLRYQFYGLPRRHTDYVGGELAASETAVAIAPRSQAPGAGDPSVVGVIGGLHQGGCFPWTSYSAPFDSATAAVFTRAATGGAADVLPVPGGDGC